MEPAENGPKSKFRSMVDLEEDGKVINCAFYRAEFTVKFVKGKNGYEPEVAEGKLPKGLYVVKGYNERGPWFKLGSPFGARLGSPADLIYYKIGCNYKVIVAYGKYSYWNANLADTKLPKGPYVLEVHQEMLLHGRRRFSWAACSNGSFWKGSEENGQKFCSYIWPGNPSRERLNKD